MYYIFHSLIFWENNTSNVIFHKIYYALNIKTNGRHHIS